MSTADLIEELCNTVGVPPDQLCTEVFRLVKIRNCVHGMLQRTKNEPSESKKRTERKPRSKAALE